MTNYIELNSKNPFQKIYSFLVLICSKVKSMEYKTELT